MMAVQEKELRLLCALDVSRVFHSVGKLAALGLIPADWPPAQVEFHLNSLAVSGHVERRHSETRRINMYRITAEGIMRLGPAGHHDRVEQATEEPRYVDPPGPAEWEPAGRLVVVSGSGSSQRGDL